MQTITIIIVSLIGAVITTGQADARDVVMPAASVITDSAVPALTATCVPKTYSGRPPQLETPCPVPVDRRWKVARHRSATAAGDDTGQGDASVTITDVTCSYTFTGDGPAPAGQLPAWARPVCLHEPPPPPDLRAEACPRGFQIGRRPVTQARCPDIDGWQSAPLFPNHDGELGRYCAFRFAADDIDSEAPLATPSAAAAAALPDWVQPDCNVVAAMGPAVSTSAPASPTSARAAMAATYAAAVERAETLPLRSDGTAPAPVRVEVLDTALDRRDDGLPGDGTAAHGRLMGLIIAQLGCPQRGGPSATTSACLVDVRNRLALWLQRTPAGIVRNPHGGHFGRQSDIARAIVAAADAAAGGRLVINLSLGWSKFWGGNEPAFAAFVPQVRAAFEAIEYAHCKGALIIAAAGNARGRPALPIGPLYPGGWADRPGPTPARCAALGAPGGGGGGGPLLYAVGGVDNLDLPLHNTPLLGRPALAAPAWQAVVVDPAPMRGENDAPLTGSSAATAVAAAAAAIVWAYSPGLAPGAVMDIVTGSGVDLGARADFCLGGAPCPAIRRASICAAATAACAQPGAACAAPPACTAGGQIRSTLARDTAAGPAGACASPRASNPCAPRPAAHGFDAWGLPFAWRQPPAPICMTCKVKKGQKLVDFVTNPANAGYPFVTEGLYLWDDLGGLWIDTFFNSNLWFTGGATVGSFVDALSLVYGTLYWGEADYSYWEVGPWGGIRLIETEPLLIEP